MAEAQKRSELWVEEETQNINGLTQVEQRMVTEVEKFRWSLDFHVGGLEARFGMQTEEAFRQGMRTILAEVGFTTERFEEMDTDGEVFGAPEQIELDVVIKNGKVIVIEIKSALDKGAVYHFARMVEFYARKTGRQIDRKLIVTPYAEPRAQEVARKLGVEVCTDVVDLHAS